jgi:inhibitor of cysteine peptidase
VRKTTFVIRVGIHVYLFTEMKMKRIFLVLIATILVAGCAAASSSTPTATLPPPPVETQNTVLEPTDHTQLITVKADATFNLVVPSNPSTGYHWNIIPELDENIVEFIEQNYFAEQPVMPGSGGMEVWTFRAAGAGDTTVVLGYYPPGEESDPEETVTFSIRVE